MEVSSSGADVSAPQVVGNAPVPDSGKPPEAPVFKGTKHKVVVNGAELEVDYDDLVKDYQLKRASHEKLQKASQIEKQSKAVIEALNKGDLEFVRKSVPKDVFKKLATDYLLDELEWESLPEGERKRIQAEKKLAEYEKKEADRNKTEKEKADQEEFQKYQQQAQEELAQSVQEVVEMHKAKGLPVDHGYLLRTVDLMIAAHLANGEKLPAAKAFEIACREIDDAFGKKMKSFTPDDLVKSLSKDQLKALNQLLITNARGFQSAVKKQPSGAPVSNQGKKIGIDEFFDKILPQKFGG